MERDMLVDSTAERVTVLAQNTLEELLNKWHSMYNLTDDIKTQRFNQFVSHLKDFFDEMLLSEETRKNCYKKEVEKKLKECKDLEKALNVSINCDIDCSETPLTEVVKHLENSLKRFEELKMQRIEKLEILRKKEDILCRLIGFPELVIPNNIPSEEDIERLEHHLFVLEEEKIKRTEQYNTFRGHIVDYINKLEVSALLDFEKSLVDSDTVQSLTLEDLEQLKKVESSYKQQFEAAKVKVEYLFGELEKLWNRLEIDDDYRNHFLENHSGVGRRTVDQIQKEIHRCEKLKKELIEPLIKKTKSQILDMCDKLCFSEKQRGHYTTYDKAHCSEDLLDILELELGKLEFIYQENSDILEAARKHRDLWERMLELEEAAKDKNRLFNNRGGQLLREEKERKTIEQTLPKMHKRLEDLLTDYEDRKGEPFLYYGENLLQRIRDDFDQRSLNKQNKAAKKNEGKHITDSASKVREKRKGNGMMTPKSENGKRLKLAGSTMSLASSATKSSNKSADGKCASRSRIALFKDQDTSVASSYSIFQEEIEEKKRNVTVSAVERQPLKDVNSPVIFIHSSPSDENTSRFNFRPRANNFSAFGQSVAATPRSAVKATPRSVRTPATSKLPLVTPRTAPRSTSRMQTPKMLSSVRTPARACTPKSRNFFETPTTVSRSTKKTLSVIKPAKFKFDF